MVTSIRRRESIITETSASPLLSAHLIPSTTTAVGHGPYCNNSNSYNYRSSASLFPIYNIQKKYRLNLWNDWLEVPFCLETLGQKAFCVFWGEKKGTFSIEKNSLNFQRKQDFSQPQTCNANNRFLSIFWTCEKDTDHSEKLFNMWLTRAGVNVKQTSRIPCITPYCT